MGGHLFVLQALRAENGLNRFEYLAQCIGKGMYEKGQTEGGTSRPPASYHMYNYLYIYIYIYVYIIYVYIYIYICT